MFPGTLQAYRADDTERDRSQHMSVRYTYSYGLDTMRVMQQCVDDHVKAGRMTIPGGQSEARAHLRVLGLPGGL